MTFTLDYSKRDSVALEQEIKELLQELVPEWTDFLDSDIGWANIKMMLAMNDHLMFLLDRQASESFLSTAELRSSVIAHARDLGYKIRDSQPAVAELTLTVNPPHGKRINLPKSTTFLIQSLPYSLQSDTVIPANSVSIKVFVKQGSIWERSYRSTGEQNIRFPIPIDLADIVVKVDQAIWDKTDTLLVPPSRFAFRIIESRGEKAIVFGGGLAISNSASRGYNHD